MARTLYDLAGADPELRFSPYCWRTKLALAHKNLAAETIPWRFSDKEMIAFSGQGRVPVLVDNERTVFDSWRIAEYLEDAYPDWPSLFGGSGGRAVARFLNDWADQVLHAGLIRLVAADILAAVHEKDRAYFRQSREARFGTTLEAFCADRADRVVEFRRSLAPLRATLTSQPYLSGMAPAYPDYIVFGSFQWARCVSAFEVLEAGDPVATWRNRLLAAFDGLAGKAPAAA
jgi:glutathione S-transferase